MNHYKLHFVPLGGIVGVTKNIYVYELWENDTIKDIIIVDCGIGFSKETDFGVDFVIPDIRYLEDKKDKVRAILLTHGHEDHITALRFHYEKLGKPPIFASRLTALLAEAKCKEFGLQLKINTISYHKEYQWGLFDAQFIELTHSIPDTTHILIKTPVGNLYHGSDFKFDLTPPYGNPPDFYTIAKAGKDGVLCLLSDSLGSENPGFTASEKIVGRTFTDKMRDTKGTFYMTTFSSNISRIRQCVESAITFNRKICFLGRSMRQNTKLAHDINYLPIPHEYSIKEEEIQKYRPNQICLIVAGSQGQYDSALSKIANNLNKNVKIKKGDTVIFSSDPIPGYENEVYDLIERLSMAGASIVYSDIHEELHASGHGNQEDLKLLMRLTKPKYLIPIGGTIRHQQQYLQLAKELDYSENQTFLMKEGETRWFELNKTYKGEVVPTKNIFVDAYGIGDVGNVILRDRETLSQEGIVIIVLIVNQDNQFIMRPQFVSRGFEFGKGEKQLFEKAEREIEKLLKIREEQKINWDQKKQSLIKRLENLFYKETGREPLVAVEVIQV